MKFVPFFFTGCFFLQLPAQTPVKNNVSLQIEYTPGHPSNLFNPLQTLGAAFDGHGQGDINHILTPENIRAMQTVGLNQISYRLRTELGIEAWHWNPAGVWSEAGKQQGYWVSDNNSTQSIRISNGYRLPRRGNTHDQANDDGYSRLDDGNAQTCWKSNPYLDEYYTKESNRLHPQWAIIDLGRSMPVNALSIQWGQPFASSFTVDYAYNTGNEYFDPLEPDLWHSFSKGNITDQKGENKVFIVSAKPLMVRFVRISMTNGSHTTTSSANDIRDKLGFCIMELQTGLLDKKKKFHSWVHDGTNKKTQTVMYVSSTDPWHRATDIDLQTEQAGVDLFFQSGLTGGHPPMMPVGLLYDTPENMIALLEYLAAKHYPVEEIEMGEEPEGQLINPQDYAALYYQWAIAIRQRWPAMQMGGPCFATLASTVDDAFSFTERTWTKLFLDYLKKHNYIDAFNFFSFEWYPFDNICGPTAPQLAIAPQLLKRALSGYDTILPANTPVYITEYGYSAYSGKPEMEIEGALMYADILGSFLTLGGNKAFLYGYEPTYPDKNEHCSSWGNNMLLGMDENGKIIYRTAAYYGMQMMTQSWAKPIDSKIEIYPVSSDIKDKKEQSLISAYAIRQPDGKWSVAIINKDPHKIWNVTISVLNKLNHQSSFLSLPLQCVQYSSKQYHWKDRVSEGYPSLSLAPEKKMLTKPSFIPLPPYSLTVIKETDKKN